MLPTVPAGQLLMHWAPLSVEPAAHDRQLLPLVVDPGTVIAQSCSRLSTSAARTPPSLLGSEHNWPGGEAATAHALQPDPQAPV